MSDIKLTDVGTGHDLALVDGDLVWTADVSRIEEVSQRILYRLLTWRGESLYDRRAGVPYLDVVFGDTADAGARDYLLDIIATTDGVDGIAGEDTFDLDQTTGVLTINATVRIAGQDVTIATEVAP